MRLVPKRLRWMGLGALAAWLFDPERGRARRNQIADKANELKSKAGLGPQDHQETRVPATPPVSTPTPATSATTTGTAKAPAAAARATG